MRRPAYCTAKADDEPCLASDVVLRLASGTLAPLERRAIERRLDECELCRRFVAEVLRQGEASTAAAGGGGLAMAPTAPPPNANERPTVALRAQPAPAQPPPAAARSEGPGDATPAKPRGQAPAGGGALGLPLPGQRVDRYLIERPLGAGGMGMVSLALDEELKRHIVIKLVRPDLIAVNNDASGGGPAASLEVRLIREAQALARLSHPNVVAIYDIGRYRGQVFFAMEYVAGVDLATYLAAAPRAAADILAKFRAAGAGLAAAHRAGVVHRDFKPANVLIGDDGAVKVADFGLARGVAAPSAEPRGPRGPVPRRSSLLDAALTHIDRTVGTPAYMAPEQIAGEGVDARSDQFAFALALTDALLGAGPPTRPVQPQDAAPHELAQLGAALLQRQVTAPHAEALLRALAQDPAARWPSMEALLDALADSSSQPLAGGPSAGAAPAPGAPPPSQGWPGPPRASPVASAPPRRRRWPLALAAVALGGGGLMLALRGDAPAVCDQEATISRALDDATRRTLIARAAGPEPFASWSAQSALTELERKLSQIAKAQRQVCDGAPPPGCAPTTADEITAGLAAVTSRDDLHTLTARLRSCQAGGDANATTWASAAPKLARARALLASAQLEQARQVAEEVAGEGSTAAPLLGAESWLLAARASLWIGRRDTPALIARATADSERAGDDGRRAAALALELELATARFDSARVEQLGELLRSLAARRGDRPRERAEVELLIAEADDELGRHLATPKLWERAEALARTADDQALVERAQVGQALADLRAQRYARLARDQAEPLPVPPVLARLLADQAWPTDDRAFAPSPAQRAALTGALELELELPARVVRVAAERLLGDGDDGPTDRDACPPRLRALLRLAAAELDGRASSSWAESELTSAKEQGRRLEGVALGLRYLRRALTDRSIDVAALQRGLRSLQSGIDWFDDAGLTPRSMTLATALLDDELARAGAIPGDSVYLTSSTLSHLPPDSLLRAEAAWRLARRNIESSKYLQGDDDLELAIPLWRQLGAPTRAATAAFWIAKESPYPRERARRLAVLARDLYREAKDEAHVAEVEAYLAQTPEP